MEIENHINQITESYGKKENWKKVQKILKPYADKDDSDPLYLINYAIALYYDYKYKDALVYSTKAYERRANDPFIMYHHGIILMVNKQFNQAIEIFKKITSFPEDYLYYGEYGDGKRWAHSLLNNVRYYIARTFFYKNDLDNAIKFYKVHLANRKRGIPSFLTKREVLKELEGASFLKDYMLKYPEKAKPIIEG